MVLKGNSSLTIGSVTRPFMKLRGSNIGTPLVVEKLTVQRYCAIEDLRKVPILNDNFKLIPYAGNLSRIFRSRKFFF